MAIYREDFVDIDLAEKSIHRSFLPRTIGEGDQLANRFGIRLLRNGEAVSIGGTCAGYFIRPSGDTVVITGTVSGNTVYVDLPQACYTYEGQFALAIKVTSGSATGTMRIIDGVVANTTTDTLIDPGTIIPTIDALLASIEAAVATIPLDYSALSNGFRDAMETEFGLSDPGTFTSGTIKKTDGTVSTSTAFKITDFIPVTGRTAIYTTTPATNSTVLNDRVSIAFYSTDSASGYISGADVQSGSQSSIIWQATNIPATAKFFRIMIGTDLTAQFKCIQVFQIDTVVTYRGNIASSDNVDNFTSPGLFYCNSTLSLPTNWPSTTFGTLLVHATTATGANGSQQYVLDYNGQLWTRYKRSAGWSEWRKVLDDNDISTDILPYTLSLKPTPTTAYDLNSLTSPGMYSIGDVSLATNYPSTEPGRLIVFGAPNSSTNRIVQVVVDTQKNFYVRYISASAQSWFRLGTESRGTIDSTDDCNNYTKNGQFIVSSASAAHWASEKTGKLIVFGDENSSTNRIIQLAIDYQANMFVRYKSAGWTAWRGLNTKDSVRTVTVKASGGDFTTIPSAVKYVTDQFSNNSEQKWLIKIDAGTYDIADEVVTLIGNGDINSQGLFINPNVTICGAGKDRTIIRFLYTGQSDSIMSNVSLFNMPYESCLMDCTLIAQNIRYCIHSALNASGYDTKYIDDVTIRCANVKMQHLGFDSSHTPSYSSPGAFGSGSTNGGKKEFYNCDFIAKFIPWFNHNRADLTKATEFIFEGCAFINIPGNYAGSSVNFITWRDNPQCYVTFRHCHINRYLNFSILTSGNGDPNNHNGYYVTSDGDLIVLESTANNSHLEDNYMDAYCQKLIASEAITAYTPVSSNSMTGVRNYVSTDPKKGIAISSAASGDICCAKLGGHVMLSMLTSTSFAVGKQLGWNGSAWVEDNTNPIVKVVYSGVCEIL